jgi:hypothetical protein
MWRDVISEGKTGIGVRLMLPAFDTLHQIIENSEIA